MRCRGGRRFHAEGRLARLRRMPVFDPARRDVSSICKPTQDRMSVPGALLAAHFRRNPALRLPDSRLWHDRLFVLPARGAASGRRDPFETELAAGGHAVSTVERACSGRARRRDTRQWVHRWIATSDGIMAVCQPEPGGLASVRGRFIVAANGGPPRRLFMQMVPGARRMQAFRRRRIAYTASDGLPILSTGSPAVHPETRTIRLWHVSRHVLRRARACRVQGQDALRSDHGPVPENRHGPKDVSRRAAAARPRIGRYDSPRSERLRRRARNSERCKPGSGISSVVTSRRHPGTSLHRKGGCPCPPAPIPAQESNSTIRIIMSSLVNERIRGRVLREGRQ